ncbi:hypothetical protein PAMP_019292 [Pampus punctatissimus]
MSRSQDDTATDLPHAEGDEAGQKQRGCHHRCYCQEAGVCFSGTGVARHQVGEEMHSELSQTQTQYKTCWLSHNDNDPLTPR